MHRAAPLHPILVHFTIALVGASLAFDLAARMFALPSLLAAAWWTMAAGGAITIATVVTGISSRRRVAIAEGTALGYLRLHAALGPTFLGCLLVAAIWRAGFWRHGVPPTAWYLGALGVVTILMTVQGFVGGELVYRFGIGVRGGYARLPLLRDCARPE